MAIEASTRGGPSEGDDRASLVAVWRALRKNWLLGAAVALAVVVGVTFFTLGQRKIYRATTTIEIDPNPPRPLGNEIQGVVDMGAGAYLNNKEYYETQYSIIKSMRLASAVVRELSLNRDAAFLSNTPPNGVATGREVPVEDASLLLISRVTVEPEKQSRLTRISYEDADPARAQRIVTMLVEVYRNQNLERVLANTNSAVDWLKGQLGTLKTELEQSELALHEFKKSQNILSVSINDQSNMLIDEMKQLNTALTTVRTDIESLSARYAELKKVSDENPAEIPARELLESSILGQLRQEYLSTQRERDALSADGKGQNHPDVKKLDAQLRDIKASLRVEIGNVRGALARQIASAKRQRSGLSSLYEDAKSRALELNLLGIGYGRLERSKNNTERLYSLVLERTKDSDLASMVRVNNISVVDDALVPRGPSKPNVPLNLALGLVGGLVLGVAFAFGRELLDRSVKHPEDVERELGLTFLGLLPQLAEGSSQRTYGRREAPKYDLTQRPELVVHALPASSVAEAARAVRTNIVFMAPDKPHRVILVTSAAPSEGKTTVACCVAIAMAQAGQRVALVDCDLRRPRLHRVFGAGSSAGVTTALLDPARLESAIFDTEVPNLQVIPCGPIPPNPAELLHSEAFGRFLDSLRDRFDRVVLDSPPVVPVTDAAILSARVDGTLLVVRALRTTKDLVRQGARALRDVGGNVIGVVLNAVDFTRGSGSYYYRYYGADGYGRRPEDEDAPRPSGPSAEA